MSILLPVGVYKTTGRMANSMEPAGPTDTKVDATRCRDQENYKFLYWEGDFVAISWYFLLANVSFDD